MAPLSLVHAEEMIRILPREASALLPITEAYPGLLESASATTINAVDETSKMAEEAVREFTGRLSPSAQLRKLVVDGRCEICS